MTPPATDNEVEERLDQLERSLAATIGAVEDQARRFDRRLRRLETGAARVRCAESVAPPRAAESAPSPPVPRPHADPPRIPRGWALTNGTSLGDLIGGRGLAWLGGIAIVAGTVLFLALVISHGWIGREARVVLAAVGSVALIAGGVRLHARHGRTEAAIVMVGAGTVGAFATAIVAGDIYALIPPLAAVAGAMLAGATATALAIRWAGRAIGALGLLGALASPLLVGAPADAASLAVVATAAVAATWVVVWRRWGWLALGTVVISAPQWARWIDQGHAWPVELLVLTGFGALGLLGAAGTQLRDDRDRVRLASAVVLALNACIVAVVGRIALLDAAGETAATVWLAGLGAAHALIGLWPGSLALMRPSGTRVLPRPFRQLSVAIGVILLDVAFGLSATGVVLVAGWGAGAVLFAWLVRRVDRDSSDSLALTVGLGAHIGLVLIRTVIESAPIGLQTGGSDLAQLASAAILAGSCLASARLAEGGRPLVRMSLDVIGLGAIAYLTAGALDGPALVAAWACEAIALDQIARRTGDRVAMLGALGFLGAAALYGLVVEAPPIGLTAGVENLGAAAIALGIIVVACVRFGQAQPAESRERRVFLAAGAATLLYLASIAIVTVFQPAGGAAVDTLLPLPVRQQGQVLLSAMWSLVGLAGLIAGLRRGCAPLRNGALSVLLLSVAKVFLYDLSVLTSIYRVISFIVLGLLLLAGAFAHQRLRPAPLPDMRSLHPSQR
jgi:Predicted membrane protein (DUF2339)